MATTADTG